jgi:hypothetical protein
MDEIIESASGEDLSLHKSWVNRRQFKALLSGFVIGIAWAVAFLAIIQPLGLSLENAKSVDKTWPYLAINCLVPLAVLYLIMRLVNSLMRPYGFEGLKISQGGEIGWLEFLSAGMGCLISQFVAAALGTLIYIITSRFWKEVNTKILVIALSVGLMSVWVLSRSAANNQTKIEQETK